MIVNISISITRASACGHSAHGGIVISSGGTVYRLYMVRKNWQGGQRVIWVEAGAEEVGGYGRGPVKIRVGMMVGGKG